VVLSSRRLLRSEMDQAALIHRKAFDERLPWLAGLHTPAADRAFFRDRVFVDCEVWGAFAEDLIGFIAFREGWIDQFYVLPQRQREGAGGALLQIAKATRSVLSLWTFQRNVAARLYLRKARFRRRRRDRRRPQRRARAGRSLSLAGGIDLLAVARSPLVLADADR
jgi:putative acetyltransferase